MKNMKVPPYKVFYRFKNWNRKKNQMEGNRCQKKFLNDFSIMFPKEEIHF